LNFDKSYVGQGLLCEYCHVMKLSAPCMKLSALGREADA